MTLVKEMTNLTCYHRCGFSHYSTIRNNQLQLEMSLTYTLHNEQFHTAVTSHLKNFKILIITSLSIIHINLVTTNEFSDRKIP